MEVFPKENPDRRFLPDLPSKNATRRQHDTRYISEGRADVYSVDGKYRYCSGKVVNVSEGGMLLDADRSLHVGDTVMLRFFLSAGTMPEGYESFVKLPARVVRVDGSTRQVALRFEKSITEYFKRKRWRSFEASSLLGILLALVGVWFIKKESIFYFWFDVPVFLYGLCALFYLLSRFFFAALYRPYPVDPGYKPAVSVVIPCFNEEVWIEKTIRGCLNQNYPEELLEVIVVDDGSSDGSVAVLERVQRKVFEEVGERLFVHVFPENRGKRHAMAEGARRAKGEVVVFVDSDSFLQPDSILQIVQPLKNPKIGAATGRCEVENKWTNTLTRMQAVRYFIGFRIFKAAESIFDAVTCLSGPLAAYRKDVLLRYLGAWVNQRYLGQPATFGDDRSLTNYVLGSHYAVYQHTAITHTIVPSTYRQFYIQQMRWKRSWLRESLRAALFMWYKEPFMAISFYLGVILPLLAPVVVLRAFVFVPAAYGVWPTMYVAGVFFMSMLMCTSYLLIKRSNLWLYGVPFCFFYLFVLLWQIVWAVLTFWKSEWGTRASKHDKSPSMG
ncbi:Hyaluronan synthase [Solidesulfovibrio carbinoliphilus subsp. oakridgensis]|uniref:N-acetylglucosaminyltransferase n=1 Tax=Solidesulfovibrio carbinoliphilus subsp. oakridgensis TaxID=694327 RepID=G7Q8M4_9BACT|nr:glycosyltransferase [Solidesulfovibrio carbinoliphilus]EHJ49111.1 Hyaluronan synthase [Solidesulfovibrio carbinoliphilus subsp. oakridgensis]